MQEQGRLFSAVPLHAAGFFAVFCLIWLIATRRFPDFSDEGFYLVSAWLAYSDLGQLPVSSLLMNFGLLLGLPYLFSDHPPIIAFRLFSMLAWFGAHLFFAFALAQALQVRINVLLAYALAGASLFVFLIPMLSYQNMPYMFCLVSLSLLLMSETASGHRRLVLLMCAPLPLGLAVISSTGFLVPLAAIGITLCWLVGNDLNSRAALAVGLLIAIAIGLSVFRLNILVNAREELAFFNSEIVYTSSSRLFGKAELIGQALASALLAGLLAAVITSRARRNVLDLSIPIGLIIWLSYFIWQLLITPPLECRMTCDDFVFTIIKCSIVALAVATGAIAWDQTSRTSSQRQVLICCWTLFLVQTYFSVASNAPLQYNLKYFSPAAFTLFILVTLRIPRRSMLRVAAIVCVVAPSLWVTLRSSYGRGDLSEAQLPLESNDFQLIHADATRRQLIRNFVEAYAAENCQERFFAAVDSLMLAYFIVKRRPPFPHAWVATRVPASRDIISQQRNACILMQDRNLAGTPYESQTMRGYLDISAGDEVSEHPLGENIFLIAFRRHK